MNGFTQVRHVLKQKHFFPIANKNVTKAIGFNIMARQKCGLGPLGLASLGQA